MFWSKPKAKEGKSVVLASCVYQCLQDKCPLWVILYNHVERDGKIETVPEGRCAVAWIPAILTEINNNLKPRVPSTESNKDFKEQVPVK